jgi:hypothetical protein
MNTSERKDRLAPVDRLAAVRAVSQRPVNATGDTIWIDMHSSDRIEWEPSFKITAWAWQRSQALALVEWLADRIKDLASSFHQMDLEQAGWAECKFMDGITSRDVSILEELAHELLETSDG